MLFSSLYFFCGLVQCYHYMLIANYIYVGERDTTVYTVQQRKRLLYQCMDTHACICSDTLVVNDEALAK